MAIINPKVAQVFANDSQQMRFIAAALEQILGEEKTDVLISEILPQEVKPSPKFKGQPLVLFNGLTREQLKTLHKFNDADVDEVYALMGVQEVATKSDATVSKEAVAAAGTATERADVTATTPTVKVVEGESEATVDAQRARAEAAKKTDGNLAQATKGNTAKGK